MKFSQAIVLAAVASATVVSAVPSGDHAAHRVQKHNKNGRKPTLRSVHRFGSAAVRHAGGVEGAAMAAANIYNFRQQRKAQKAASEGSAGPSDEALVARGGQYTHTAGQHSQTAGQHAQMAGQYAHTAGQHAQMAGQNMHMPGHHTHTAGQHAHVAGHHIHAAVGQHPHTPGQHTSGQYHRRSYPAPPKTHSGPKNPPNNPPPSRPKNPPPPPSQDKKGSGGGSAAIRPPKNKRRDVEDLGYYLTARDLEELEDLIARGRFSGLSKAVTKLRNVAKGKKLKTFVAMSNAKSVVDASQPQQNQRRDFDFELNELD